MSDFEIKGFGGCISTLPGREEHKTNVTTMILLLLFFARTNTFYEELPGKEQLGA